MRALQLTGWKQPPEIREVRDPEPGPGQVVVRVAAAGACHSDLHLFHDFEEGMLPFELPFTLGHETAGWVSAVGAGVDDVDVDEPVAVYGPWGCGRCRTCRQGMENYCVRAAEIGAAGSGLAPTYWGSIAELMEVITLAQQGHLTPHIARFPLDAVMTAYEQMRKGEIEGRAVIQPEAP